MNLVVFDCDGTIADSQYAIVQAMTHAFAAEGLEPPPRERVLDIVGLSLAEAMARLIPTADADLVHRLAERYRAVSADLRTRPRHAEPLFPDARETLVRLAMRGDLLLGIATGKSRAGVDRLFAQEGGLKPLFATVQTSDIHPSKPHPAMLEAAMRDVGVGPERTVMVGDSTFDVSMARAAGVAMIGVKWGYHSANALAAAGADVVADDFAAIEPAVDRLLATRARAAS